MELMRIGRMELGADYAKIEQFRQRLLSRGYRFMSELVGRRLGWVYVRRGRYSICYVSLEINGHVAIGRMHEPKFK